MSKRALELTINKALFEKRYSEVREALFKDDKKVRIYIDTNIFGRAIDGRIDAAEAASLRRVMGRRDDLDLFTSEKTRKEISNHPAQQVQDYLEFVINLVGVIPEENFVNIVGGPIGSLPLGSAPVGGGMRKEDPVFTQVKGIFDPDDSEHIFQAIKSKADYFLTLDNKTILSRRADFHKLGFSTKLVSPKNLEAILFAVEDNTN